MPLPKVVGHQIPLGKIKEKKIVRLQIKNDMKISFAIIDWL